ncbi:MAG: purine-nucleoside phosphorylase [Spirochaetales bacterium]|nr:MAG: purine-nucleoside phosphorylase [Spirochaetales bacterium]
MSIHIGAKPGEIADTILLPGDPLRAQFIAETYLENASCYNSIRGMLGYTGTYKGRRVSVQGTGMGIPSISIYVQELIDSYGVRTLFRVGSCGSIQPHIKLRDVILAMTASTDSSVNKNRFSGKDFSPAASFDLLSRAYEAGRALGLEPIVGNVFTTDLFYHDDPDYWKLWAKYGILAIEMETTALYTIAAKAGARALTLLTVSDDILTGGKSTAEERQKTFTAMVEMALAAAG